MYVDILLTKGVHNSPVLTYENTHNEILVSWSPDGSDRVCGPVMYNVTVIPSYGMMMMINDTVYNITGLNYNTNYTITVYATNRIGDAKPAIATVNTKYLSPGTYVATVMCIAMYIYVCNFQVYLYKYTILNFLLY